MNKIESIAQNTSYLTLALILQKIISFSYFVILARNFVPEDLGKYYFALSFTTVFSIFIDFGLANLLTREIAKKQNQANEILTNVVIIKTIFASFVFIGMVIILQFTQYSLLINNLIYISSICMILDSFTTCFFAIIRGFHNLIFESVSAILFQIIVFICGITMVYLNYDLTFLMASLAIASIINFGFASFVLFFKIKVKFIKNLISLQRIRAILILVLPFSIFAILQKFYTYFDSVLLYELASAKFVGLYQVAFKIILALQFLPMAFTASLYPAMTSYFLTNKNQLIISFERALNYLVIISLPISFGIISLIDEIIVFFQAEYIEAILPTKIIVSAVFFIFINFPIGSLLNACDKQMKNTMNMAIVLAVSIILNYLLIPHYQVIGASITVLATNLLMFILGIYQVKKIIKFSQKKFIIILAKSLLASSMMTVLVVYLKEILILPLVMIIGGFVYFLILFLLGGFAKEDVLSIYKSFRK